MRNDELAPPPRARWNKGAILAVVVIVAVLVGGWMLGRLTRDVQTAAPRMLGGLWTAPAGGTARVYYAMEEERAEQGYFDSDMLHSYRLPYSIFTLHARNARDGGSPTVTTLGRRDQGVAKDYKVTIHLVEPPEILGPQGNLLWIWMDSLTARDLGTLAPVWTAEKIKALNPELGKLMPKEHKYYKVLGGLNALVFKGADARFFQIDPGTGAIQPVDEARLAAMSKEYTKTADSAFSSLDPESNSLWSTSESGLMWDSLIDEAAGKWYGLLTANERAPEYWKNPRYGFGPSGEVSRALFQANCTIEPSKTTVEPNVRLDPASVSPLGTERFLMGGFLRRPNVDSVWFVGDSGGNAGSQPADGRSCVVLHRKMLGADSPWQLTRVGLDGKVHWTRSTGLADLEHLSDGSGAIVFSGFADHSQPTNSRPDLLVFVDEKTGKVQRLNLVSDEMAAIE